MSGLGKIVERYFNAGLYTAEDVEKFVTAGRLTQEEYDEIVGVNRVSDDVPEGEVVTE